MKYILRQNRLEIPKGVTVSIKNRKIVVEGPRGKVTKDFRHIKVDIKQIVGEVKGVKKDLLELICYLTTYKQSAILYTISTHISNMIKGVTQGFRYKMVCVKKHFPINASVSGNNVEIKNFIGCKENILVPITEGVQVIRYEKNPEGELWFEGNDKDAIANNCARVNQSCNVGVKDKRKFLDGIYVSEKGLMGEN
jgi:large subunit ribosomal protein L9e